MLKVAFWLNFIALVTIQTIDMLLTEHYIGDNWQNETFPVMSLMIKNMGIHPALWVCRLVTYTFLFFCLMYQDNRYWNQLLTVVNVCYWTSMIGWLFNLRIIPWPIK